MDAEFSIEFIISSFVAASSTIGLLFVGMQTIFSSRLSKAVFLDKLSDDIDKHVVTELELEENGRLHNEIEALDKQDHQRIVMFLSFFDRIAGLYKLGFVNIKVLDAMFAYRFFILLHNPNTQKFVLLDDEGQHFWLSVFALHKIWYAYRKRKKLPILRNNYAKPIITSNLYKKSKL